MKGIADIRVVMIAAGYAHCILLDDGGRMHSSGYNDRGQLGLGHRISTAEFKRIDFLERKFVVQVVCGNQHSVCRAIDRISSDGVTVGSGVGSDVYVWGNGMLGQLGLGRRGTTKGRLLPTLLMDLHKYHPLGIGDVAAGGNFTAAVTVEGQVYSWGHAEYNQHGTGSSAATDYIDAFYYYVPRPLTVEAADPDDPICKLSCGFNFVIGLTRGGDAYSWGWGSYGVLGHGKGHYSAEPARIVSIGPRTSDSRIISVSCGSNHVLAVSAPLGCPWAATYHHLLDNPTFADAVILVDGVDKEFLCHRVVLSARCAYFRGYLQAAAKDELRTESSSDECDGSQLGDQMLDDSAAAPNSRRSTRIILESPNATQATVQALLEYIYLDRVNIAKHKGLQLEALAKEMCLHRLAQLAERASAKFPTANGRLCLPMPSTFQDDLRTAVQSDVFADVEFCEPPCLPDCDSDVSGGGSGGKTRSGEWAKIGIIFGHQCILSRLNYFETLFGGSFKEKSSSDKDGRIRLTLDSFIADGIDGPTFKKVLHYLYAGTLSDGKCLDDISSDGDDIDYMPILVAANRFGLMSLVHYCEKQLAQHLHDFPENIVNCLQFAQMYNFPRLERQCQELLVSTTPSYELSIIE